MAKVRLSRYDAEEGRLPDLCMRCGAEGTFARTKTFSWFPQWVYILILGGLLPFAIVALVLTKRMRVEVPLCPDHQRHWMWRNLLVIAGLIGLILLGIGAAVLIMELERRPGFRNIGGWVCGAVALLGLIWLIVAAVLGTTAIRPSEITDRDITLIGVSEEFAEAYREEREARRRRRSRYEYEEPPRRRYHEEDDEEDYGRRY
jgi:hypothetical protein